MVRALIILTALLSTHCGAANCTEYEYMARGVCVRTHGHKVEKYQVSSTVNYLTSAVNKGALDTLFLENRVEVNYVEPSHGMLHYEEGQARGVAYQNDQVYVGVNNTDDFVGNCMEKYYVLGHELMHVVARHKLGVDRKTNKTHNIPGYFYIGTPDEGFTDTTEHAMAIKVFDLCNRLVTGTALSTEEQEFIPSQWMNLVH